MTHIWLKPQHFTQYKMLFTLSQTIICLLQIHGLQDQIFLNYSNSPLRSSSQILPPKSLLFSFLIHEIKQFLCTSHLIAPFSTIILGKTLIASRGLIFTLEFCTSKLIHSSVLAYSSKMSSGDSPLKRQKITVKVKKIEKGQFSPPSKPPTTPSQDADDKKQQLPPPLATEPEWVPGNTLSQHPVEIRQALFMKKKPSVIIEKKVMMEEFEDYDVMDPLYKMGWGGILELESDICYDQPIIDWMSTLQRHGEGEALTLTGTVRGREYTLTHHKIRRMFSVDTGIRGEPGRAYEYPDETYLEPSNLETQDWIDGLRELFFLPPEIQQVRYTTLGIADLKPQAKVLWKLGVWNIFPREGYQNKVRVRDISILYGLISGKVAISYAHLVMLNLLAMYESACKSTIPHGYLLSRFLDNEGGISTDMEPRWINVEYRTFTQQYIPNLEFSLEPPFHIVDWEKRTFVADFGPAEREIVEREKGERVRRREERRFGMQEQASGYLSPITERKDPLSVEENIDLNMPDDLGESLCPSPVLLTYVSSPGCCTIYVQGYKVNNSYASILETIFMKHGDIAAGCMFKAEGVRASFLELVCEVVTQLQTNDDKNIISLMEELESKVSEAEKANIHVSWLRSRLEARKKSSLFTEIKAKISMVKKAAEMEMRKRREELMAAQQRFEEAERCVKVLDLVENKLDNNILDSKTEPYL